jgi:hypothetical protein
MEASVREENGMWCCTLFEQRGCTTCRLAAWSYVDMSRALPFMQLVHLHVRHS